jgi:hypothetical protein
MFNLISLNSFTNITLANVAPRRIRFSYFVLESILARQRQNSEHEEDCCEEEENP